MKLIYNTISVDELKEMCEVMYDNLVRAVVDIEQEVMVVDTPMSADAEMFLLEGGSKQENLWGIKLYPYHYGTENFIIFDSTINIRPSQGNRSRIIENVELQKKIKTVISKLVRL